MSRHKTAKTWIWNGISDFCQTGCVDNNQIATSPERVCLPSSELSFPTLPSLRQKSVLPSLVKSVSEGVGSGVWVGVALPIVWLMGWAGG